MDTVQPRLSEHQAKQKVQVKVQVSGTTLICAYTVVCNAAIVCYARANDGSAKTFKKAV